MKLIKWLVALAALAGLTLAGCQALNTDKTFRVNQAQLQKLVNRNWTTTAEKLANAKSMAEINQLGLGLAEKYFNKSEIRVESGSEPEPEDGFEELPLPEQRPEDDIEQQ